MSHEDRSPEQADPGLGESRPEPEDRPLGDDRPTDEELRAQLEEELKRITVRDILLQTVVSLVNLGGQRLGLAEGTHEVRDLDQVRTAIEGVRALLPVLEAEDAEQVRPVRDALSQLQMAYAREIGGEGEPSGPADRRQAAAQGEGAEPAGEEPSRGRQGGLWVPPGSAG